MGGARRIVDCSGTAPGAPLSLPGFRVDSGPLARPPARHGEVTALVQCTPKRGVCFIVPTYNEAPNVVPLLRRLAGLYPDPDTVFLIVDDESPDGTGRLVREFAASDERVRLLEGPRRGFGRACVRGMVHALDTGGADAIVLMDADFSHDPRDAQRLLARLRGEGGPADGADVAVGSRYVPGGTIDPRWRLRRRLLSRWGNRFARWVAGIRAVHDCTSGFKAIRADALRAAKVEEIRARGATFQVEILHRLVHAGARVVEEPIHFREREHGRTKLGAGSILEFFYRIWWLGLASHRTLIRYGLVGLAGAVMDLASFQALLTLGLHKFLASPIATELSIVSNFLLNDRWTFAHRNMAGSRRLRALRFNFVALAALALSYATFVGLSLLLPRTAPVLLQACGIPSAALFNYFMNSRWTFRETQPKTPAEPPFPA